MSATALLHPRETLRPHERARAFREENQFSPNRAHLDFYPTPPEANLEYQRSESVRRLRPLNTGKPPREMVESGIDSAFLVEALMGAVSLLEDVEERFWEAADKVVSRLPRREATSGCDATSEIAPMRSRVGIAPVITGEEKRYFDRITKAATVLDCSQNSTRVTQGEAQLALKIAFGQYVNFIIRRSRARDFDLSSLQSINYLDRLLKANLSAARLVIEEFESLSRYMDGDEEWLFNEIERAASKHSEQLRLARSGKANPSELKISEKALKRTIRVYAELLIRTPSQSRHGSFHKLERLVKVKDWMHPIVREQFENLLRAHSQL